jgi:hypothetical protein
VLSPNKPKLPSQPRAPKVAADPIILEAYLHANKHRVELQRSTSCGCFFCFRLFGFDDITKWIDANQTALCPRCGIDAVLGSSSGHIINDAFLRRMHMHWFATSGTKYR